MSARKKVTELNSEQLRNRLRIRSQESETKLRKRHPIASEFYEEKGFRPGKFREHAARIISSGALAGSLLLSQHAAVPQIHNLAPLKNESVAFALSQLDLTKDLETLLPKDGSWQLSKEQEKEISEQIQKIYGVHAVAELDGNRLNNSYGRMGAEQHLPRYPGDTIYQHDELQEKGQTPGRGAWGYFAYSKEEMTPELYETEKWYVAVQTLYLPDWNTNTAYLRDWYKYRRVVVVNPANGKAVVAAIADAGPSEFTGKKFGGSPEVMKYLNVNYGMQNHPVILFFLDDPNKEIKLGPLEYNIDRNKKLLATKV